MFKENTFEQCIKWKITQLKEKTFYAINPTEI